ncbi:adhesion G-protein coupled receptor G4 [Peromyscus californicus insignis]|uniref:adhesion G-protein coupled receptor G4 n=1 Tax=Peromyscus californicus insignis TaxID=564181 RepID=UPI0022A7B638|nr:adhesion G-protein coupled receptor G4 [Peromyscus californicus insignis]
MKNHILYQKLYGLILVSSFIFLSDSLSLKGKRLDFYGEGETYVHLTNAMPELSRLTACIDLISMTDSSHHWMAFSYITNNTLLGREDVDLGLAGDHQQLILYSFGKTFYISYHLIPFHWHTMCLIWDGVKGRLELFRNKERILAIMDQPHSLPPDGTLVLGHFPRNGEGQIKTVVPRFTGSLYYFQLWDRILENEEFMTCLYGNVVSWEDDVWLIHKTSPTVDRRLRCFVSENMTIQETSTTVSQQIDLTTPFQITALNPQKTVHPSTVSSESMPVSTINHAAISYSNTIPSPLATVSASKDLKTSMAQTATFSADVLFTSTSIPLSTQSTPIHTAPGSMKVTQHSNLGKTKTTKMLEVMGTETFHPTTATDFFNTSGITKNSIVSETLTTKSQSAAGNATSFLMTESTSMSTTSRPKHKSTDVATLSTSKSGYEFLVSSAARTASWSTLEETSAMATDIGIASTFPAESLLTSTAAPMNSVFSGNQVASTLSTTDAEMAFTVHSVLPMRTTPAPRTVKTESVSSNSQAVFSPSIEDAIYTPGPKETSSMVFSSITSSPVTGTRGEQTVTDTKSTHLVLTPRTKLVPTLAETSLFPTMEGLVYTQNTPTTDEPMLTLISTKSLSTYNATESGLISVTDKIDYQFFTNETTWTSKPNQILLTSTNTTTIPTFMPNENLTSSFQDSTTNIDNSSMTTNITLLEASTDSKGTTSSDPATTRYTTALFKSTSRWLSNFSSVTGITSITSQPEAKLITLLLKSTSMPTVAANELPSISRETVVPLLDVSTLADIKPTFSTEKNISETTQMNTNGMSTFGVTMAPLPMSATAQRVYTTVTKETTSHHPKVKSTIAAVAEVSPFSAMLEATDESTQMVTASVTVSPFSDREKLTTALDNETATTAVGVSWLSTKLMKSTPESSYDGTTATFNLNHTYTVHWTSETSEGKSASSSISVSTQTLPRLLGSSTRIMGSTFSTTPSHKTAVSLSACILSPQTAATPSSATPHLTTHKFSLPVNVSAVTSPATRMAVFDETTVTLSQPSTLARDFTTSVLSVGSPLPTVTMTTVVVPPVSPTPSTTSDIMPTHRDSLHTTSEFTEISSTTALTAVSSLRETLVPSLRPPTPVMITKAINTLPSISADLVSPSIHTLVCSRPPPSNITFVASTYVSSTTSTSVATSSVSQVEDSTHVFSFPYTFSSSGDVNMASGPTESSTGGETMSPLTSVNKLTTSVDTKSTTYFVNTPISTQLTVATSMFSSENEQTNTSMGKTLRTTRAAEISPSKNSFISDSQSTFPWEMTDTEFSETTEISSHQTHLPSEIPPGNPTSGNLTTSIAGSTQTTQTLTSSTIIGVHVSEGLTSLEETALPSQLQTITKSLSPDKERTSTLSEYPSRTVEKIVSSSPLTHPDTGHQATSPVDTTISRTARISHPVLTDTTLSHLPLLKTQPESTWIASSTSENTQTFLKSLSPFTTGLLSTNFTMIPANGGTTVFSVPNEPTNLPGETSMETSTPTYQMSLLPLNVTTVTPKKVSDTPTILMTKSSRTINSGYLKSLSIGTSGLKSEKPSKLVNDSDFSTTVVSSDTSTRLRAFFTSVSSPPPKTTKTTQVSTLNITPVSYSRPTSQITTVSPTFTNLQVVEMPFKTTTAPVSSPAELDFSSVKTIPTIIAAGTVTSVIGTTTSSLFSSKNTEAISFIPKTMFSSLLSTTQQSPQEKESTTLDILPGITTSSLSTESSGGVTEPINTYSITAIPASGLPSTPLDSFYTSSDIQVSPSVTNFKGTPRPPESVKSTLTYLSRDTGKMTSLSGNILLTSELTKSSSHVNTSVLYPSWTQPSATPPSLTSFLYSPHSTEAKFPLTSQTAEFPTQGTRITPRTTQSLLTTSRNTPRGEDSPFPVFTTNVMTPNRMETETLHFTPGTLSTSQIGLVSRAITAMPSIFTLESLPTFGLTENTSLSVSSIVLPTMLAAISRATSPTWSLSSLPSGSLTSVSNPPHFLTSPAGEMAESMFPASDTIATPPNFTTVPFSDGSSIPTQSTPVATLDIITVDSLTSLPISTKTKGDSPHTPTALESSARTTVADNSWTVSEPRSFSRMSISPSITSHDLPTGSLSVSSPTKTAVWSKVPATSESHTLIPPKPTQDSVMNIATTPSIATGPSFPWMSAEMTRPSTATGSSLISSSFKTTWIDSTFSFLFTQASTLPTATVSTVSFYNTKMSFSVFDEEPRVLITTVIHEFTKDWLNFVFQNSEFSLANLAIQIKSRKTSEEEMDMYRHILEQKKGQGIATIFHIPYSCACWVIIKANSSLESVELISRIRTKIHGNLTHANFTRDRLTLLVKSDHVVVEKLEPGKCEADETPSKYKGTYKWPLTDPTETAQVRCIKNENRNVTRICSISSQTGKCQWEKPSFKQCKLLQGLPDKIVDLANITISDENADDVAEHILNLVKESPPLDEEETKIIVSKVDDISNCDEISTNLTQMILQIISTVTEKQSDPASNLPPVSNKILRIIERAGHKMEFVGRTANLTVARLALAVLRVDHRFEGMAFSIHSSEEVTTPQIFLGGIPLRRVLASIYLPQSLREKVPLNGLQTILFNFFGQTSLFKAKPITTALMTYVVSASISNTSIQNLADPVIIILKHIQGNWNYDQVYCAFWDFDTNNGLGGWNSSGCKVKETNVNYTICQCNHLTHFGVLMDLSRSTVDAVNERILVIITYTGCGISSIFLGIAMVTYIAFHKLRKDYPSKILINLCTALLMLNLAFLVNSWMASFQQVGLCITAAVALHYFLLVSLTWMGLEAVHMYFALVKVFNTYIPNYILKFCLAGWGIPAITVAIILSIRKDLYGTLSPTTPFCWIKDDRIFYISVVAYFCLIFLMNLSMFCIVLVQLTSVKSQSQKTRKKMILNDLKGTISLTFLLGLTWGFAFFAWGPVRIFFMYLFAICNTLQGFLIFVFYCVMKESVREQWQRHLHCRWFRLDNFSGKMFGINVRYKQKKLKKTYESKLLTPSLKSTITNSTFKSMGSVPSTPSEINFPNGDFDDCSHTSSSLGCEAAPTFIRRALPAEIKTNSIQKQRSFSINVSRDAHLIPSPGLGEMFNL